MAERIVVYYDSITHRMLRLLNDYPEQEFTRGQLLAASERPVARPEKLTPIPLPSETTVGRPRSATVQLANLLSRQMMSRRQGAGPRTRGDGSDIDQWLYTVGRVRLHSPRVLMREQSAMRPGMKPAKESTHAA